MSPVLFSDPPGWTFDTVAAWRDAAVADGWAIEPTYGDREPVERAARLTRDGFQVQMIARPANPDKRGARDYVSIHAWGPDSKLVGVPFVYSWDFMVAGLRRCNHCGASDVDTFQYSFGGRCCAACLPAMKAKHEQGNWTE